ncbi:phosphotransferase [Streptomonospora sp. S1-112]|uniref:Phosphotransferase n=1 Tax=Streptomonospora mangrovi TaxID=2883123 RepID=A0A9X3NT39_9ACTN|nr:phosphotransferase [Streptomonospora mangrovi]MDA0566360.1 phosphotransferase [Streptomonospora mangrovi]
MRMHADQITVAEPTAAALVAAQFPQWASLPLSPVVPGGTVHTVYRMGERLALRFPLTPGDPAAVHRRLAAEAAAAREIAGHSPVATPRPVAIGGPGEGYPLPWAVWTWLPGTPADQVAGIGESTALALDVADLIRRLRAMDVRGRVFAGSGRGGRLADHDAWVRTCLERSEGLVEVAALRRLWERMRDLPRGPRPDVMSHTDLIPGNLLVRQGRLTGLLDVGGLGPADPALDLVSAWHLLEKRPRDLVREALDCDGAEWERGRAWAFEQAIGLVWYYLHSNPPISRMGLRTLRRITEDAESAA